MSTDQTSFFFYDLETSGLDPRSQRIMQFAGQRTTMDLQPIGEPINVLVKLTDEVLPSPTSILITGITPQLTVREGISEAEFVKMLNSEALTEGTIMVGFNNVRFDDEFMRFTLYRNFHDPYEWAWKAGRSRWDLLDVVRLTRALRPDGIVWPTDDEGDPINTLVALSAANGLLHAKAHDAMSDVEALIAVAQLLRQKQPRLWQYLLNLRSKHKVIEVIRPENPIPFVYTSNMYGRVHSFTTVAIVLGHGDHETTNVVWDLRADPSPYLQLSPEQLKERIFSKKIELEERGLQRLPVKELGINKCPAVAPLSVLDEATQARLELDMTVLKHHSEILAASDLPAKIMKAYAREQDFELRDVDGALYEGFVEDGQVCASVRNGTSASLAKFAPDFRDRRLPELYIRYKARNFPEALTDEENTAWETYRAARILTEIEPWSAELQVAWEQGTPHERDLLTQLQLWAESIYPANN